MAKTVTTTFSEPALTNAMITGNYSTLTINIYFSANNSDTYFNNRVLTCTCNGSTQTATVSHPKRGSVSQSFTFENIGHNSDGTKSVSWSWNITTGTTVLGNLAYSGTQALQTIPRASTPTVATASIDLGSSVKINTNRLSTSFTHTLTYSIGSLSGDIASNVTTEYTWTPPASTTGGLNLASAFPNATSGVVTITCKTYNGATLIGTKTCTLTVKTLNNGDYQPTIQLSKVSTNTFDNGKHLNKVSGVTINAATGAKYNATVNSYTITGVTTSSANNPLVANPLNITMNAASQDITISGLATDTRGYQGSGDLTLKVYRYNAPTIDQSATSVQRCDNSGDPATNGTYALITLKYTYQNDGYSNSLTTHKIKIGNTEYTLDLDPNETTVDGVVTGTATTKVGNNDIAINSHYSWTITLQDAVQAGTTEGTTTISGVIQTSSRIINVRPRWQRNSIWQVCRNRQLSR